MAPGVFASVLAIPLGTACALALWRRKPAARVAVSALCILSLLASFVWVSRGPRALVPATLVQLCLTLPITILILMPRLEKRDPVLMDSANASGASPAQRFRLVVLPWLAVPALAALALCLGVTLMWAGALL